MTSINTFYQLKKNQKNNLIHEKQKVEKILDEHQKLWDELNKSLLNTPKNTSTAIHPELEVASLNYYIHQREQQENLLQKIKDHQNAFIKIDEQLMLLERELIMYERYFEKEKSKEIKKQVKKDNDRLDDFSQKPKEYA